LAKGNNSHYSIIPLFQHFCCCFSGDGLSELNLEASAVKR
jgi:hypothetical protein